MALKIEKFQSPGKGNGLRATSLVSPGDHLYSTAPYTYTLCEASMGKLCEFCLRENAKLLRCSRCKTAKYCNTWCQMEAWLEHKRECKCLMKAPMMMDSVRPIGRFLFKILINLPCPSEELYSMFEHQSHLNEQDQSMREFSGNIANMVKGYLKKEIPDPSQLRAGSTIPELMAIFLCNRFTIIDSRGHKLAVGLYPSMSLLNHSCEPNCTVVFDGRILLLRAVKEIQAGEELTISYTDSMMPTEERQLDLRAKYFFICDCGRCQRKDLDDQMLAGDQEASFETKVLMDDVPFMRLERTFRDPIALCKAQLEKNADRLPDTNIYQLKMLNYLMNAYIDRNLWDEALPFGIRTLQPYRVYNQGFVPMRAQQMGMVGKLLCHGGKLHEAMELFSEALIIMKVTNGAVHAHTLELKKILKHCEEISRRIKMRSHKK